MTQENSVVQNRQAPTIGRVVLYARGVNEINSTITALSDDPFRADVCFVHANGNVNLLVCDHCGFSFSVLDVPLIQCDDEKPATGGYAYWMQYQVKQHAKNKE